MKLRFTLLLCVQIIYIPCIFSQIKREIRTNLHLINADGSTTLYDGSLTAYDDSYSNNIDEHDAKKMANFSENFGMLRTPVTLVIERRHTIESTDTIFYKMWQMQRKTYKLEFVLKNMNYPGMSGIIEDNYLKTATTVDLNGVTSVTFTVTENDASSASNRFRILFALPVKEQPPVQFSSVKAYQQNDNIAIEWNVEKEVTVKQYEVEVSANGQHFAKAVTIKATPNISGNSNYHWTDEAPVNGNNFYRVSSVDVDGKMQYSSIMKVFATKGEADLKIYPNPVINGVINLQILNQPKGNYVMRMINNLGQIIQAEQIQHHEGNSKESIQLNKHIGKGTYQLQIVTPDNRMLTTKVFLQ
jgi:hypothetical protein